MLKKLEQKIRPLLRKIRGKKATPKLYRDQERFRLRYPSYEIGVGTYGMPQVHDWNEGSILKIGNYCSIANNVQILLGGLHRTDWISTFPFPAFMDEAAQIKDFGGSKGDVIIGNDVWLCTDCIILSGVTIGHGAVVACGTVVTRDIEPYSIVAGNPARHIRWRFEAAQREALLRLKWWDWPEQEIRQKAHLLCSNNLQELLDSKSISATVGSQP